MSLLARTLVILNLSTAAFAYEFPHPPEVFNAQVAVLSALPARLPSANLRAFEALVADDVKVYRDGTLVHQTRKAWLDELQSYRQRHPNAPRTYSVSRDHYHSLADGGISVREFSFPDDRQQTHHPLRPYQYVTYYVEDGRLVRVVYGPSMSAYVGLCQAVEGIKAEAKSNGTPPRIPREICH
jgi:hypothetical protein